jgi:flavin reductase (DIM6/NTAB) family NADH-FMN oxidoreductase RutF
VASEVDTFESLAGEIDYPMYVVTAASDDDRAGCLVGFLSQCSIDPARVMVWLSKRNRTYRVAVGSDVVVVHLLRAGDDAIAELFGGTTGDEADKFDWPSFEDGPSGVPVLDGCDWFAGRVLSEIDGGDHAGFLIEPFGGRIERAGTPQLGFQATRSIDPGHDA